VATAILVSDLPALRRELRLALEGPDLEVLEASTGPECLAMLHGHEIDLAVVDMQVANMGGMAICLELRHEESYGAADHVAVLMLLDRRPDVFLARRSGAEGFLLKPLDPSRLRRAVAALLDGETYEDDTRTPPTVRTGAITG
jgi:DNA-binding response OmpR family regulator